MGGELTVESQCGQGTAVRILFDSRGGEPRVLSHLNSDELLEYGAAVEAASTARR
eukprot:SAG11_NODE_1785_length_4258_cov_5.997836_3_plen_55_part_00